MYSLCVAYPEPLADRLYQETRQFLEDHVNALREEVGKGGERALLRSYFQAWRNFSKGIGYLHMLYSYLNNQHIKKQKMSDAELTYGTLHIDHSEQMKEIGELGLDTWKRLVRRVSLLLVFATWQNIPTGIPNSKIDFPTNIGNVRCTVSVATIVVVGAGVDI